MHPFSSRNENNTRAPGTRVGRLSALPPPLQPPVAPVGRPALGCYLTSIVRSSSSCTIIRQCYEKGVAIRPPRSSFGHAQLDGNGRILHLGLERCTYLFMRSYILGCGIALLQMRHRQDKVLQSDGRRHHSPETLTFTWQDGAGIKNPCADQGVTGELHRYQCGLGPRFAWPSHRGSKLWKQSPK